MILLYLFILGICFGSLINGVVYRLEKNESMIPRSHCDHCHHILSFYEMIPIISWVFLQGKCKVCQASISIRYPIIEIITGILFILTKIKVDSNIQLILYLIIIVILIMIALVDYDTYLIRDRFNLILFICGLILLILEPETVLNRLIGTFIISIPLFFLAWLFRGVGYGDVKLMASAGLILGAEKIVFALMAGSIFGSIPAFYWIITKQKNGQDEMPFGPCLVAGILFSFFFKDCLF